MRQCIVIGAKICTRKRISDGRDIEVESNVNDELERYKLICHHSFINVEVVVAIIINNDFVATHIT